MPIRESQENKGKYVDHTEKQRIFNKTGHEFVIKRKEVFSKLRNKRKKSKLDQLSGIKKKKS